MDQLVKQEHHKSVQGFINTEDIVYGYCTEFMVKFKDSKLKNHPFSEEKFRNDLSEYGDSLLVIADDQLAKVHIHTEQPGVVLTYGQQYGDLINLKIENMRQQHTTILENDKVNTVQEQQKQPSEYGIVAVSMGSGIRDLLKVSGPK